MNTPKQPVFFLHITKCGGTSLRAAMLNALTQRGAADAALHQLDAPFSAQIARTANLETMDVRDLLLASTLNTPGIEFVAGHYRYTDALHEPLLSRAMFITVLREPVDRFLSLYYYNHYKSGGHGHEPLSLEDYITRPRARRSAEDYVRLFRGTGVDHREFASDQDVDAAIRNLQRFDLVGELKQQETFCASLSEMTGLEVKLPLLNRSPAPAKTRHQTLPKALQDEITRLCAPSTAVYDAVMTSVLHKTSVAA